MKKSRIMIWSGIVSIILGVIVDAWWWSSRDIQATWEPLSYVFLGIFAVLFISGIVSLVIGCVKNKNEKKQAEEQVQ